MSKVIDSVARQKTAEALRHFAAGRISNFEFEESIPDSDDPVIAAIRSSVWCFYDDFEEHRMKKDKALSEDEKRCICRWIMFLYTNQSYCWPSFSCPGIRPLKHSFLSRLLRRHKFEKAFMSFGEYEDWPFISEAAYLEAKRLPKLLSGNI